MSALLIGFLVVAGSAALFGVALFGRRPIPQSAIGPRTGDRDPVQGAETAPSRRPAATSNGSVQTITLTAADVRVPTARRIRSALLLALSMLGMALLAGTVLSIVVVGLVLLIA